MYSYLDSAFSKVLVFVLIHCQCTCTHKNVLGPRSDQNHHRLGRIGLKKIVLESDSESPKNGWNQNQIQIGRCNQNYSCGFNPRSRSNASFYSLSHLEAAVEAVENVNVIRDFMSLH